MSNKSGRNKWMQLWSYREGTIVTVTILALGFGLQLASGGAVLSLAGFPWNLFSGIIFLALVSSTYFFGRKYTFVKSLVSVKAALPAILGFTFLVLLMGFVKQDVTPRNQMVRLLGLTHLVKTWPFILINVYLLTLLGVVTLKRLSPFNLQNAGFFLNHSGLFLVMFSLALGSGDVQRLTMNCYEKRPVNRATDENGRVAELPFSVELLKFNIDEFRPKVVLVDNITGKVALKKGKAIMVPLDRDSFELSEFNIRVEQFLPSSAKLGDEYIVSGEKGSVTSARIKVTRPTDRQVILGWVCSGNYNWPSESMKLDDNYSLVLLPPEPRKFSSELEIVSGDGKAVSTTIEVNKPLQVEGWSVYQLGYNTDLGRWSEESVLQLVRDPWLPAVYLGIFMMMAGAGFLFTFGKPKHGETEYVA